MNTADRRAAIAAYKERKAEPGVYAVRCAATGEVWVGGSPNLASVENRIAFMLRHGGCPSASLQAAFAACAPETFAVEVLERLDTERSGYLARAELKNRTLAWRTQLSAQAL